MIVDDVEVTRREIRRLKLWGQKTEFIIEDEAKNGYDALLKLKSKSLDLVITDIKMPKVDGLELLQKVIDNNYCSCIILMSDYSDFNYVRQGLILGAFDYILKPINEAELNKTLQRAKKSILDKRKQQEKLKKMEQELNEKVEIYLPKAEVEQIIKLIYEFNPNIFENISYMVDKMSIVLKYDSIKIEIMLKNILLKMESKMFEHYTWFKKFFSKNDFIDINFSKCNDVYSIKELFMFNMNKHILKIFKLQCSNCENGIVADMCKLVLENIDGEISLKFIADKLFMNKTYISEAFKQKTGISFIEYLTMAKMERAIKLIADNEFKVYEIASKLGFKDTEYFSKVFKNYTGHTPSEFRHNM
jgi:two-component system response regulator YesN